MKNKTLDVFDEMSPKAVAPRRARRGLGIVELGLYLIIVALLVAAVIVAFYQVQTNSKQSQTTNMVNEAYTAVQDLHRSAMSYGTTGTDLIPILENAGMVPGIGRRVNGGVVTLETPFGDNVAIEGNGSTFIVTIEGMSQANCIDFMSSYAGRSPEQSGLAGASSNAAAFTFPVDVASINSTCADGDLALEYR